MPRLQKVTLKEDELAVAADAHARIAEKLDFPDYYGNSLDALADCLGDICQPTRITIVRSADERKDWFDAIVETIKECCQESSYVGCVIKGQ
jgi:ribonuclease inhibitor